MRDGKKHVLTQGLGHKKKLSALVMKLSKFS